MIDAAPALEMLWEPLEPHGALAERFGFADAASAARWVAATVREQWDIRVTVCERIVISDRTALAWVTSSSGRSILKWSVASHRFRRLALVADLTHRLGADGLPVSVPLRSLGGPLQVELDGVSVSLQRVVPGELLDVADDDQVRAAGRILAGLHQALAGRQDPDRILAPAGAPEPLATRVTGWLDSAGDHVPGAGLSRLRRLVADAPPDPLPIQVVHGDFRSSNILWAGSEIAAVLDLEEARLDHCVDEVARSAIMLGTRFRDWGPVSARVRATFLSGYESVRRLTTAEQQWWEILVLRYALSMVPPGDDPTGWATSALGLLATSSPDG